MYFREELDLFFTTGISFFSMMAFVCINIDNILMEVLFWIVAQYVVIVYPNQLYSMIVGLCVMIAVRYKYLLRNDWKERMEWARKMIINRSRIVCLTDGNKKIKENLCDEETEKEYKNNNNEESVFGCDKDNKDVQDNNTNDCCEDVSTKQKKVNNNWKCVKPQAWMCNNNQEDNYTNKHEQTSTNDNLKHSDKKKNVIKCITSESKVNYPILVSYRAYLNLMVIISIFACDFPFFPQKHLKTDFYGLSLMDVGIGSYLFNNGCLHSYKTKKTLKTAFLLFILGCTRLLTVYFTDYKVNITEYGKHMNFYFTLSFTYLLSLFRLPPRIGLLILILYDICLRNGLDIFIFSEHRNTLFLQNKEGLFQLIPSLCIFILTQKISTLKNIKDPAKRFIGLLRTSLVFVLYYLVSIQSSAPSRRLGNSSYVSWILALHSVHLTLTIIAGYFVNFRPMKLHMYCSDNFMFTFLFANVIILVCNLCNVQRMNGHLAMAGYLLVVFVVPYYFMKMIKKK